jgi:hypothetical protein
MQTVLFVISLSLSLPTSLSLITYTYSRALVQQGIAVNDDDDECVPMALSTSGQRPTWATVRHDEQLDTARLVSTVLPCIVNAKHAFKVFTLFVCC